TGLVECNWINRVDPVALHEPRLRIGGRNDLLRAVEGGGAKQLTPSEAPVPPHAIDVDGVAGGSRVDIEIDRPAARNTRQRRVAFDLTIERRVRQLPGGGAGVGVLELDRIR